MILFPYIFIILTHIFKKLTFLPSYNPFKPYISNRRYTVLIQTNTTQMKNKIFKDYWWTNQLFAMCNKVLKVINSHHTCKNLYPLVSFYIFPAHNTNFFNLLYTY